MKSVSGNSMLPAIFPGARVEALAVDRASVQIGDVVCFPGHRRAVVAHRVVGVDTRSESKGLLIRGDSQSLVERVPNEAIAYRVARVHYGPLSYGTGGLLGRCFSRLALAEGLPWRLLRGGAVRLSHMALRIARLMKGRDGDLGICRGDTDRSKRMGEECERI